MAGRCRLSDPCAVTGPIPGSFALTLHPTNARISSKTYHPQARIFPGIVASHRGVLNCYNALSPYPATIISGKDLIMTNTPVNDLISIHTKQAAYLTYVIGLRVPAGSVTRALYWDTPDPYHYVRLESIGGKDSYDVLIVGCEDHKTGQKDDAGRRFAALERWTRTRWPRAGEILYRWSGEVMEPVDSLAFIGPNPLASE